MVSWKEVLRPFKRPRSIGPSRLNPIQTAWKTTSSKKLKQHNKKSRSVTIQLPEEHDKKGKVTMNDNSLANTKPRSDYTPNNHISTISKIKEIRSVDNRSITKLMTSDA